MDGEVWRPITRFTIMMKDGSWKYEVSNLGRVRRCAFTAEDGRQYDEKILKQHISSSCLSVNLAKGDKIHKAAVHRLVALAFCPHPEGSAIVRHLDGDRNNNVATNLKWVRWSGSHDYRERVINRMFKACARPVQQYSLGGKLIAEYPSIAAAAKAVYISSQAISHCCRGKSRTSGGFLWCYADEGGS